MKKPKVKLRSILIVLICLATCLSCFGYEIEYLDYFTVKGDKTKPSISLGMYIPSYGQGGATVKETKKRRLEMVKKWKEKEFYGLIGDKLVKLELQKFVDIMFYEGDYDPLGENLNLEIVFKPTKEKPNVVFTSKLNISNVHYFSSASIIQPKEIKELLLKNVKTRPVYFTRYWRGDLYGSRQAYDMGTIKSSHEGTFKLITNSHAHKVNPTNKSILIEESLKSYTGLNYISYAKKVVTVQVNSAKKALIFDKDRLTFGISAAYKDIKFELDFEIEKKKYLLVSYIEDGFIGRKIFIINCSDKQYIKVSPPELKEFAEHHAEF